MQITLTPLTHCIFLNTSSFHGLTPHTRNKHINHPPTLPRILARLHRNLNPLHERHNQIIHLLAPPQLIGI
jgi:hypothetical protein